MRDIIIPKSVVELQSVHCNKNIMFIFYIKYSVNVFPKNTIWDVKNKKENVKIVKNYFLNVL